MIMRLTLALLSLLGVANADQNWEKVSDKNGIIVDRRPVEGTKLKEFRGRGVIEAPITSILAVFNDIDKATEWMDQCKQSSLVEDHGDRQKIVYNRTKAQWPVSDRDAVLMNNVFFDEVENRVRIEFSTVDGKLPAQKGVVRMPYLKGHWYMWPESHDKTRVEYEVHADPGGSLPAWLVNYVSRELPRKTITGLAKQVKRRSYPEMEKHIREFPEIQSLEARFAK
jgi:hypothetical protein